MTNFGLTSIPYVSPQRTWLADRHGTDVMPGVPLDLTKFNAAQHYPNGFIPDGCVLGKVTSSGKYAPYLASASDGTQTAVGILFNPVSVFQPGTINGTLNVNVSGPILLHGFVNVANLPFNSTNQALGGYIDSAAQTALKLIAFLPAGLQA